MLLLPMSDEIAAARQCRLNVFFVVHVMVNKCFQLIMHPMILSCIFVNGERDMAGFAQGENCAENKAAFR